jgi:hypothetical protein
MKDDMGVEVSLPKQVGMELGRNDREMERV